MLQKCYRNIKNLLHFKKVLTIKKVNDIIIPVQKTEKEAKKMQEEEIILDFSKLRGRIKEIYGTQTAFATAMLMNEATLSNKLNNNVEFSPKEIYRACLLLCIDLKKELTLYFFTPKVQNTEKQ